MAANDPKPCPLCKRETLRPHCLLADGAISLPRCGWWSCSNKACDAVLDFRTKRGHVLVPGAGQRRKVEFLPGGEVA